MIEKRLFGPASTHVEGRALVRSVGLDDELLVKGHGRVRRRTDVDNDRAVGTGLGGHGEIAVFVVLNAGEGLAHDARHDERSLREGLSETAQLDIALRHAAPEADDVLEDRIVRLVVFVGNPLRMHRHSLSVGPLEGEQCLRSLAAEVGAKPVGGVGIIASKRAHPEILVNIALVELPAVRFGKRNQLWQRQVRPIKALQEVRSLLSAPAP